MASFMKHLLSAEHYGKKLPLFILISKSSYGVLCFTDEKPETPILNTYIYKGKHLAI